MASFNLNITGGSSPYTISVKAQGDNTERFMSYSGGIVTFMYASGIHNYDIVVSKVGCTSATQSFTLNCDVPVPTPVPIPSCTPISGVAIAGTDSPKATTSVTYNISYVGSTLSSGTWSVSGGASITYQETFYCDIVFPSAGSYTILYNYTSCGNNYSVSKVVNATPCTAISNLSIFGNTSFNENQEAGFVAQYDGNSSDISSYYWTISGGNGAYIAIGQTSEVMIVQLTNQGLTVNLTVVSCGQTFTSSKTINVVPAPVPIPNPTPVPVTPTPIPVPVEVPTPVTPPQPVPIPIPVPVPVPIPTPVVDCSCVYNFVNPQATPVETMSTYNSGSDTYSVTQTVNIGIFNSGGSCDPTLTNSLVNMRVKFVNPITSDVYYDNVVPIGTNSYTVNYPGSFYRRDDISIDVQATVSVNRINGCTGSYTVDGSTIQNVFDWGDYPYFNTTVIQPNCGTSTTGKIIFTNIKKGVKWKACNASSFICANDCSTPDGTITSDTFTFDSGYINGFGNQSFTIRIWTNNDAGCASYTDFTATFTESLC